MTTRGELWETGAVRSRLGQRRVEMTMPLLKRHVGPDMAVLDLGCGPGVITLDIAGDLTGGSIVGLDRDPASIEVARKNARARGIGNASFRVGDAYRLDFPAGSFELVYSSHLLEWLANPVDALIEQARVTRPGGKVVCQVIDAGTAVIHPDAPHLSQVIQAFETLSGDPRGQPFLDSACGRKMGRSLREAGFLDFTLEGTSWCAYPGSPIFEERVGFLRALIDPHGPLSLLVERLLDGGGVTRAGLVAAAAELEAWRSSKDAYFMSTATFAAARVMGEGAHEAATDTAHDTATAEPRRSRS